jgi:hypothetical protein
MDIFKTKSIGRWRQAFFLQALLGISAFCFVGFDRMPAQDLEPSILTTLSGRLLLSSGSSAIPCFGYDFPIQNSSSLAFGIDSNQTIHLLWTGYWQSGFNLFAFYSSSADGQNWSPCQIIDTGQAYEPQVVVDATRSRVHLIYRSNLNGISHRIVQQGTVSNAVAIDNHASVVAPSVALETGTGGLHAVWQEGYLYPLNDTTLFLHRTYYSRWNGSSWSAREQNIYSEDTAYSSVSINPAGGLMLAWFQNYAASLPKGGADPGISNSPRTAFSLDAGLTFPLRVGVTAGYTTPQTDSSLLLGYSAADSKFHLLTNHFMWPAHSIVYRNTWDGVGAWSAPEDLGKNALDWAAPVYVGSSQNSRKTIFIWKAGNQLQMRLQNPSGTYSTVALGSTLAGQGYTVGTAAYQADNSFLHIIFNGQQISQTGIYYVKVPIGGAVYTYLPLIAR